MIGYWLTADTTATTYSLLGSKADYIDKELEKQVLPAANKAAITLLELEKPSVKYHANGAASGMDWSVEVATNSSHTVQGKGALTAPLGALVFKGWSTLPDGTGLHYSAGSTLSVAQSDIDLYAQWGSGEIKPFVNYHANGASGADRSVEVTANASHTVQEATGLTAPGALVFKGWNTQPGGGGTTYAAGSSLSVAEADVDLYAQWGTAASNVSVYYHANGAGSGSDWSVEVAANSSHTVQEAIGLTAPRALVFKGWNTQPGGGGTAYAAGSSLSVAEVDVDLYAQWGTTTGGRKDDDDDWTSSAVTLPLPILPPKTGGGGGAAWLLCVAGGIALAFAFRKKRQSAK
ncbi:MAG: InlB B-repeat-containing protein [Christensenellaceae bacterium]|nr:InlB B-repeat-containing protein [Christensenellaceae bacterium]